MVGFGSERGLVWLKWVWGLEVVAWECGGLRVNVYKEGVFYIDF